MPQPYNLTATLCCIHSHCFRTLFQHRLVSKQPTDQRGGQRRHPSPPVAFSEAKKLNRPNPHHPAPLQNSKQLINP